MQNTTGNQDKLIQLAEAEDHLHNLLEIISSLDSQITDWKDATGCDDPRDAEVKIQELEGTVAVLESRVIEYAERLEESES